MVLAPIEPVAPRIVTERAPWAEAGGAVLDLGAREFITLPD
jgi:hypothetical protein